MATKERQQKFYSEVLTTPPGIACFPSLFSPKQWDNQDKDKKPQYGFILVLDKEAQRTDEFKAMVKAAREMLALRFGKEALVKISSLADVPSMYSSKYINPFKDHTFGDYAKDYGAPFDIKGNVFIKLNTTNPPGVVNARLKEIIDPAEVYGGCICRATCVASAYEVRGNRGTNFLLNNVQKMADGERLDNRRNASEDFDAVKGGKGDDTEDDIPF